MSSLPWGVILLMLIAVGTYWGLFRGALACWRLSLEGALLILLLLIGGDFITLSWRVGSQVIRFHVGSLLLVAAAVWLWFFQSGFQRWLLLGWGIGLSLIVWALLLVTDRIWLGTWFHAYWVPPFVLGMIAAVLTRNIAGILWLTLFPMVVGQTLASLYWAITDSLWFAAGSSQVFDMALLAAGSSCLLVTAMQFVTLRRMARTD